MALPQIVIDTSILVSTARAVKKSRLETVDYLAKRAKNAPSRKKFERVMAKVPIVNPEARDRL